jgi:nucleotide-binding universal stress UspA family protein
MYQRILVAVDGSDSSSRALLEAVNLANVHHAALRIVHVIDEAGVYSDGQVIDPTPVVQSWIEAGRKLLDQSHKRALAAGIDAETRLVENETIGKRIAEVIVEEAATWHADLLVSGTHGRSGLKHLLMGSVAEGIVRICPIPILLIRSPAP